MKTHSGTFFEILDLSFDVYQDFQDRLDQTLLVILQKIFSNLEIANILIFEHSRPNESEIILRSAMESVVLFCYLVKNPDEIKQYKLDCEMLKFKNNFIDCKDLIEAKKNPRLKQSIKKYSIVRLKEENEKFFDILEEENKKIILNIIGVSRYELSDDVIEKLDIFFQKKFKPVFMRLEDMYKQIKHIDDGEDFHLRESLFIYYNLSSQIAHGAVYEWTSKKFKINSMGLNKFISIFKRIILLPYLACKSNGIVANPQKLNLLKKEVENTEKIIGVPNG